MMVKALIVGDLPPDIERHRDEAYDNGYDDAMDDIRQVLEALLEDEDDLDAAGGIWIVRRIMDAVAALAEHGSVPAQASSA